MQGRWCLGLRPMEVLKSMGARQQGTPGEQGHNTRAVSCPSPPALSIKLALHRQLSRTPSLLFQATEGLWLSGESGFLSLALGWPPFSLVTLHSVC